MRTKEGRDAVHAAGGFLGEPLAVTILGSPTVRQEQRLCWMKVKTVEGDTEARSTAVGTRRNRSLHAVAVPIVTFIYG